jgi:hypothetical protein
MVHVFDLIIENDDFSPKDLTINQDDEIQIFISGFSPTGTTYTLYTEEFSSTLAQSQKILQKFKNPGEFRLKCKEVSWMSAKITVLKKINQNDSLNNSQISNSSRKKKSKNAVKTKRKAEKNFVKKLQTSDEIFEKVFDLISNSCKDSQGNLDNVSDIQKKLISEVKTGNSLIKIPDTFKERIQIVSEDSNFLENMNKMSKLEVVERTFKINLLLNRYFSSLSAENIENMLEERWNRNVDSQKNY